MAATEPAKIRNIAVAGHRGVGKTSLVEALLFQAGKTNRLGTIEQGTTVSDWDEHEQKRVMSLSGSLCHLEWKDRKINLVDTPGDAGFQADTFAALRVVEGVVVVLSGVMGVEVNTSRVWNRAEEYELSRVVFINMLDRERADFFRVLEAARVPRGMTYSLRALEIAACGIAVSCSGACARQLEQVGVDLARIRQGMVDGQCLLESCD